MVVCQRVSLCFGDGVDKQMTCRSGGGSCLIAGNAWSDSHDNNRAICVGLLPRRTTSHVASADVTRRQRSTGDIAPRFATW